MPRPTDEAWPEDGLEYLGACLLCGAEERRLLYENLGDIVFKCAPGRWNVWRCQDCSSAYLDPRPTEATIHLAYADYFTHAPAETARPAPQTPLRKLRRSLANGYRNRRYGTAHADGHWLGAWILAAWPPAREALDVPFRYLPRPQETKTARLLDVGCGNGGFLNLARTAGWQCFGCDPDPVAVEKARALNLDVREGGIETWRDEGILFDAVTLSHVIEHVHDPARVLRAAYDLLQPGGVLYLDTPNADAIGHEIYREHWRGLEVPRHLVLFTFKSLRDVLRSIGFTELRFRKRNKVFKNLSALSAQLEADCIPEGVANKGIEERMPSLTKKIRAFCTYQRPEFLTLTCRKQ